MWTTDPPRCAGYTTGMDDEPPLTEAGTAWLAELLPGAVPRGARMLADLLGLDDV